MLITSITSTYYHCDSKATPVDTRSREVVKSASSISGYVRELRKVIEGS